MLPCTSPTKNDGSSQDSVPAAAAASLFLTTDCSSVGKRLLPPFLLSTYHLLLISLFPLLPLPEAPRFWKHDHHAVPPCFLAVSKGSPQS